jgi:hypothetical protein
MIDNGLYNVHQLSYPFTLETVVQSLPPYLQVTLQQAFTSSSIENNSPWCSRSIFNPCSSVRDDWHVTEILGTARASFRSTPWGSPTFSTRDVTARRAPYRKCLHKLEECLFHLCDNIASAFVAMQERTGNGGRLGMSTSRIQTKPLPVFFIMGGTWSFGWRRIRLSTPELGSKSIWLPLLYWIVKSGYGNCSSRRLVPAGEEIVTPWGRNRNIHRSTSTSISIHLYTRRVCFADHDPGVPADVGLECKDVPARFWNENIVTSTSTRWRYHWLVSRDIFGGCKVS